MILKKKKNFCSHGKSHHPPSLSCSFASPLNFFFKILTLTIALGGGGHPAPPPLLLLATPLIIFISETFQAKNVLN